MTSLSEIYSGILSFVQGLNTQTQNTITAQSAASGNRTSIVQSTGISGTVGTSQVVSSDGAGIWPSSQIKGEALVLLNTLTAAGSTGVSDLVAISSVNWGTYKYFKYELRDIQTSLTSGIAFNMIVSNTGGSSWFNSAGNYAVQVWATNTVPQSTQGVFSARAGISFSVTTSSSAVSIPLVADVMFYNPGSAVDTMIQFHATYLVTGNGIENCWAGGNFGAAGVNGVQFNVNSGTFSGTVNCYGLRG